MLIKLIKNYKTLIIKKKFMMLFFFLFDSSKFDLVEFEKNVLLVNRYDDFKNTESSIEYNDNVIKAEVYLRELGEALFYEKFNSNVVKEILLWFKDKNDVWLQSCFMGLIVQYHVANLDEKIEISLMYYLNFYRLGFLECSLIRGLVWSHFIQGNLKIQGETGFKQYLRELVDKYKKKYNYDDADNVRFEELLNYNWAEWQVDSYSFVKDDR